MTRRSTKFLADPGLRRELDELGRTLSISRRDTDPVAFVHAADTKDQELIGFIAATLAFGNVKAIMASIRALLIRLGPNPRETVIGRPNDLKKALQGFRHRWAGEDDVGAFLRATGRVIQESGSIEAAFHEADRLDEPHYLTSMRAVADRMTQAAGPAGRTRGFRFLVAHPSRGGAMKRLNLFLRWMVREGDGVDLGLWTRFNRRRLIVPLDVHVAFHARVLGMSRRKTADLAMALEVTEALKALDPADPLRYDFALCHLGIHGACQKKRVPSICRSCPIDAWCRLPKRL